MTYVSSARRQPSRSPIALGRGVQRAVDARPPHGGTDDGLPGLRESYGPTYFAAFARDPDGFKIEAVCLLPG